MLMSRPLFVGSYFQVICMVGSRQMEKKKKINQMIVFTFTAPPQNNILMLLHPWTEAQYFNNAFRGNDFWLQSYNGPFAAGVTWSQFS